jgi:hypothetical protein
MRNSIMNKLNIINFFRNFYRIIKKLKTQGRCPKRVPQHSNVQSLLEFKK